jgi:hypothetical protein
LEGWPEAIDPDRLGRHFQLDGSDVEFVRWQNGASGQRGIALQLCALRWLGFFPDDLPAAPEEAIGCLADALDVPVRAVFDSSVRPQTRWEHRPLVRDHAGFVAVSERVLTPVREWLIEQAMEHERPSLLFSEMCAELRRRGIERPSVMEVMRHVGWARERAHEQTFQRLAPQLTDAVRSLLDGLLVTEQGQSRHAWLGDVEVGLAVCEDPHGKSAVGPADRTEQREHEPDHQAGAVRDVTGVGEYDE